MSEVLGGLGGTASIDQQYTPYDQKYVDAWPSQPYVVLPQTVTKMLEAHNCTDCLYML